MIIKDANTSSSSLFGESVSTALEPFRDFWSGYIISVQPSTLVKLIRTNNLEPKMFIKFVLDFVLIVSLIEYFIPNIDTLGLFGSIKIPFFGEIIYFLFLYFIGIFITLLIHYPLHRRGGVTAHLIKQCYYIFAWLWHSSQ